MNRRNFFGNSAAIAAGLTITGVAANVSAQPVSAAEAVVLYGDGIHDDTKALQALLDTRAAYIKFPLPKVCYFISKPLKIYSGQELSLDRYCHIKLMPMSNCVMLQNADPENGDNNITVTGGIWDLNNLEQEKNPLHFSGNPNLMEVFWKPGYYNGTVISFWNVKNLKIAHLTIKDPVTFSIMINVIEYFTVEDITFDFNYGNPWAVNMDGVHLCGNCHFGVIRNLKGSCFDDMVAINADEGEVPGPVTDIQVDGLFADDCHSAVRLLSANYPVERVSISNVYGTYYQYCIGITKYYAGTNGYFDGIVLKNSFAAKAPRHSVYRKDGSKVYPFIWVQRGLTVKNLSIENVYRKETNVAIETIGIDKGAKIENLSLSNIVQENLLPEQFPLILNNGEIENLNTNGLRSTGGEVLINNGAM
jgi:polygalacturonase